MSAYHIPVLLNDSVDGLNIKPKGVYVDATYGGGGHSAEILKRLRSGKLFAFDQDKDASKSLPENNKFFFILGNFRFLKNYLKYYGISKIDGLLADLGVSSHQFDLAERGFTYRIPTELDMRMNQNSQLTAEQVINDYESDQLTQVFRDFGELQQARKLAATIVKERVKQRIVTNTQLISCIDNLIPKQMKNQFLSKVFQAVRIEVNHELESLKELLSSAAEMLNPGGRLVVISYHSLEDRLVKNFMRWGNVKEQLAKDIFGHSHELFNIITRKPITANEEEIENNPRARSARLRIAEKN
jgi:16S rRNA (cytosine1402-N4)-methyltransferase